MPPELPTHLLYSQAMWFLLQLYGFSFFSLFHYTEDTQNNSTGLAKNK